MRVLFLGSPPFATPVLESLLASSHTVCGLVTRPDKPRGRGRKIEASPLVELARARNLPVLQPAGTKSPEVVAELARLEPEVLLVASYGEILRTNVLELAPHGALNVHGSLLPRHRGAAPVQAAILAGDATTGISVQRMVLALDEGDVLLEREIPIDPRENAGMLFDRLAALGGEAAVAALDRLADGTATFTPQDPAHATYARRLKKDAGRIDWTSPTADIDRLVRAMTPWPGARTTAPNGRALTVIEARPFEAAHELGTPLPAAPGTLLDPTHKRLVVATGDGALLLECVKPEGKAVMEGDAWLRGARPESGAILGIDAPRN